MKCQGWGNPTSYIQFSNLSKYWDLQIYWLDEEGSFISRNKTLLGGDKHVELTSALHTWVIIARANIAAQKRNNLLDLNNEDILKLKQQAKEDGVGSDAWCYLEERRNCGNLILAVKPCLTSILLDRCSNLVWIPWKSLSVSQRQHPETVLDYKLPPDRRLFNQTNGPSIRPNMHIQVLDIASVNFSHSVVNNKKHLAQQQQQQQQLDHQEVTNLISNSHLKAQSSLDVVSNDANDDDLR